MARKKKTIIGQMNSAPAQRQFTDRERPQKSFLKALENINNHEYSILTYYGVGGIGKSSLKRHLKTAYLESNENAIYSSVDFDLESNRIPHKAFRHLAKDFKENFKVPFTAFDLAYTIYWTKAFPEYDLKKDGLPFIEEGSVLSSLIDTMESAHGGAGAFMNVIDYGYRKYNEMAFDNNLKNEISKLKLLDAEAIENKLGIFFAYDIDKYKEGNPEKKVVIFLDTYEALWQQQRTQANALSQDEWIRDDLVSELPNVLFIICGREKIKWEEVDSEWGKDLNQHMLGSLSEEDAKSFLESCDITDTSIQDEIIKSSEGLPYYLDLCVDTYYRIKDNGGRMAAEEFSEVGEEKIFERFMRYLSHQEQETLKVLANARFYTKELFSLLIEEFKTGYPITAMQELNTFSFIVQEDDKYYIHDLMRSSLISFQNNELKKDVNQFLFNYYDKKLHNFHVKNNNHNIDLSFQEAFFYKEKENNINELIKWVDKYYMKLYDMARYRILLMKVQYILEGNTSKIAKDLLINLYFKEGDLFTSLGLYDEAKNSYSTVFKYPDYDDIYVKTTISLGYTYRRNGEYLKALEQFEKAYKYEINNHHLDIKLAKDYGFTLHYVGRFIYADKILTEALKKSIKFKNKDEEAHISNFIGYNLRYFNRLKKSLRYIQKAITIRESLYGDSHPITAESYNNYAGNLRDLNQTNEAYEFHIKAYRIRKSFFGETHPDTSKSYNSLALYYYQIEDFDTSIEYNMKALKIRKIVFPENHFYISVTNRNLGYCYLKLNQIEKSLAFFKESLLIRKKYYGKGHSAVANIYFDIAKVYHINGERQLAQKYLDITLDIYYKLFLDSTYEWEYFLNILIHIMKSENYCFTKHADISNLDIPLLEMIDDDLDKLDFKNYMFKF